LSDLEKITKQAYAMVSIYGLNDKVGNISYYDSTGQNEYSFSKPYSEKTGQLIDEEVSKMIEAAYVRTKGILLERKEELTKLAELLLEKEVIFKEDVENIFGKRPVEFDVERVEKLKLEQIIADKETSRQLAQEAEEKKEEEEEKKEAEEKKKEEETAEASKKS